MANEATLFQEAALPITFTVADGTGIEKGSLLKMTDPRTAIIHSGINDTLAGIAAEEKIANDGKTTLAVYKIRSGNVFKMILSGGCTVGDILAGSATANKVYDAGTQTMIASSVGYALETGADGESILVLV